MIPRALLPSLSASPLFPSPGRGPSSPRRRVRLRRRLAAIVVGISGIAGIAGPAVAPRAGSAAGQTRQVEDVERLIGDLGHPSWPARERAQSELLRLGREALPALRRASRSPDLEVAQRARFVLEAIDPVRYRYRVIRLIAGAEATLGEIHDGRARDGEEVELAIDAPYSGSPGATVRFAVQARRVPGSPVRIEIQRRLRNRSYATPLAAPSGVAAVVEIVERGEETFYLHAGGQVERDRRPFLTLFCFLPQRESEISGPTGSGDVPEAAPAAANDDPAAAGEGIAAVRRLLEASQQDLLDALLAAARVQARAGPADERLDAVEILGRLGRPEALPELRLSQSTPSLRRAALAGLTRLGDADARRALAAEVGRLATDGEPAAGAVAGSGDLDPGSAEAIDLAVALAEAGDAEGVLFLASQAGRFGPNLGHRALASLSDHLAAACSDAAACARLVEVLGREEVVEGVPWNDPESLVVFTRAVDLALAAGAPPDAGLRALLAAMAGHAARLDPAPRLLVTTLCETWSRVARGRPEATPPVEVLIALLTGLEDHTQLAVVFDWLFRLHDFAPLPAAVFEPLLDASRAAIDSGDPTEVSVASGALVQLSKNGSFLPPQLRRLLETLLAAAERGQPSYVNDLHEELSRWLGAAGAARRGPAASAAATRTTLGQTAAGQAALRQRARAWMADDDAVAAASATSIIGADGADGADGAGGANDAPPASDAGRVDVIEALLLLDPSPGLVATAPPAADARPADLRILDGTVVRLAPGETILRRDRRGEPRITGIDALAESPAGQRARYRHSSGMVLTDGLPQLTMPRGAPTLAAWFLDSDAQLSPVQVYVPGGPTLRLLLLATAAAGTPPPAASPSPEDTRAAIIASLRRALADAPDDLRLRTLFPIIAELDLVELVPEMQPAFAARPGPQLAQHLLRLGDRSVLAYLRAQLSPSAPLPPALEAAAVLVDADDRAGLRYAIEALSSQRPGVSYYMLLRSLDEILERDVLDAGEREEILAVFMDNLHLTTFQARAFHLLQREAGTDFGFLRSQQLTTLNERRAAQQEAVDQARKWWDATRASRDASRKAAGR